MDWIKRWLGMPTEDDIRRAIELDREVNERGNEFMRDFEEDMKEHGLCSRCGNKLTIGGKHMHASGWCPNCQRFS